MPLRCGVPLPVGETREVEGLDLTIRNKSIDSQLTPLAFWPDGSIRSVLIECLLEIGPNGKVDLYLHDAMFQASPYFADESDESSLIDGAAASSEVNIDRGAIPLVSFDRNGAASLLDADIEVVGSGDQDLKYEQHGETLATRQKSKSTFICNGSIVDEHGNAVLGLKTVVESYSSISQCKVALTLHNPRAAIHAEGFWDLGDEKSVYLKEFSVVFRGLENTSLSWHKGDYNWREAGYSKLCISQLTSGGETKHSPNHMNSHQSIPDATEGFTVEVGNEIAEIGSRICPAVEMTSPVGTWALCPVSFWQNFPKVIHREEGSLKYGLLPGDYTDFFELQGGEKKTHTFYVGKSGDELNWVNSAISVQVGLDAIKQAGVLPYNEGDFSDNVMDSLIEQGINGPNNFFVKRESIDEYGWRNFGDVHADHETHLLDTSEPFSSHYNNQYDLIYGFLRMYLLTAKTEWFQLGRDLAEHVIDIDIYHTDEDRLEYNGGLFWHTDHYRPAETSSHRSYSRHQEQVLGDKGGGGPGGEHCYTTGLKLYFFMTGDERTRSVVLGLAKWVRHFYDGGGTLSEEILRILRSRIAVFYKVAKGVSISRHRYPIHRGIGNLIVAQLDAFEITCERTYLNEVEAVILGAIGPEDELVGRGLRHIEENWFYSIFLQALIRYLDTKRQVKEFDATFFYARDSLLHYADWIVSEERPYLETPDVLEYPNHTWAAQDIRRCAILLDAYRYADVERQDYLDRSRFFAKYVVKELKDEPTSSYTRILAILMQNHGASAAALGNPERYELPTPVAYHVTVHKPHSIRSVLREDLSRLFNAIRCISFRAEWKWLRLRFG